MPEIAAMVAVFIVLVSGLTIIAIAYRNRKRSIAKMETRRELMRPDVQGHLVFDKDGSVWPGLCHCSRKEAHEAVPPQQTKEP